MKADNAIHQIIEIEDEASLDTWVHRLNPLVKLLVTAAFLGLTVSVGRYDLSGVIIMCIYPFAVFAMSLVSFSHCIRRIWPVIPLLALLGAANIFMDRETAGQIGRLAVSYGVISFSVLIFKGTLTVMACYLLIATTGIENICHGLTLIRIPKILITLILLTYRYMWLLAAQAGDIFRAYTLRAPGQKGINVKAWGPLLGQLLIRTVDRAETVYDSMLMRGYNGNFPLRGHKGNRAASLLWMLLWTGLLVFLRFGNAAELIGRFILEIFNVN